MEKLQQENSSGGDGGEVERIREKRNHEEIEEQNRKKVKRQSSGFPLDCWTVVLKFCDGQTVVCVMRLCKQMYAKIPWKLVLKRIPWETVPGIVPIGVSSLLVDIDMYSSMVAKLYLLYDTYAISGRFEELFAEYTKDFAEYGTKSLPRFATTVSNRGPWSILWSLANTPTHIYYTAGWEVPFRIGPRRAFEALFWSEDYAKDTTLSSFTWKIPSYYKSIHTDVTMDRDVVLHHSPSISFGRFHALKTLNMESCSQFLVSLKLMLIRGTKLPASLRTLKFTRMDLRGIEELIDPKQITKLKLKSCVIPASVKKLFVNAKITVEYEFGTHLFLYVSEEEFRDTPGWVQICAVKEKEAEEI